MAINKKLIHFKTFENFNSQKLSANEENTKYTLGIDGEVLNGTPDILYQSIVWIKDTKQQWTHGQLYNGTDSLVTESTISEWGFTKNTGTYSKPSGGIPKTDLASAVQTSLGKADTALQSYTEKYTGTITGIKMNGASKGTSGVVDLGTVITAHQDISGKQDKLVSGSNIKTINGESIIGEGTINVANCTNDGKYVIGHGIFFDNDVVEIKSSGIEFIPEKGVSEIPQWSIHRNGDGTKFLSDDGTYKTISGGGSSGGNVQAVDTGDVIDDVTINYATKTYVDGLVGNINSILESIING